MHVRKDSLLKGVLEGVSITIWLYSSQTHQCKEASCATRRRRLERTSLKADMKKGGHAVREGKSAAKVLKGFQ